MSTQMKKAPLYTVPVAKMTMPALAMVWLLAIGAGVYQTWPAQHLQQEALPELPALQDCPTDFERCFATALKIRMNMGADQLEFSEGYASRVRNHLAVGVGVFLLPFGLSRLMFGLSWLWRDRRAVGTKIRNL